MILYIRNLILQLKYDDVALLYRLNDVMEIQDSVWSAGNMNIAKDTNFVIRKVSNAFYTIVEIWVTYRSKY